MSQHGFLILKSSNDIHRSNKKNLYFYLIVIFIMAFVFKYNVSIVNADIKELEAVYLYENVCGSCDAEGDFLDLFNKIVGEEAKIINVKYTMKNTFEISREERERYYRSYNIPKNKQTTPTLIIGDTYLTGQTEIEENMKQVFISERDKLLNILQKKETTIIYFYVEPCSACDEVSDFFDTLKENYMVEYEGERIYSDIGIKSFNIDAPKSRELLKEYFDAYQVKEKEKQAPIVFIGDVYFSGVDKIRLHIVDAIKSGNGIDMVTINLDEKVSDNSSFNLPRDISNGKANESDNLYFLYSEFCETCKKAEEFLDEIEQKKDIKILKYEINKDQGEFREILKRYDVDNITVPVIIYKNKVWGGYNLVYEKEIADALDININNRPNDFLFWNIDDLPMIFSTIVIGLIDGFNPCSLWALFFIMSMILRFNSRQLILTLGITYVLVVSLVYGLFIVGVFGVVTYILDYFWLRFLIFALALFFAMTNILSFFINNKMLFSISSKNKKLFIQSIRSKLYSKDKLIGLIIATILIGILASLIELPCTAGFPLVWNTMMSSQNVAFISYVFMLLLYLFMYVLVEMVIVVVMVITLSKSYMKTTYARSLKLVSGMLMAYLSVLLLLGIAYLNNTGFVIGGSVIVVFISVVLAYLLRGRNKQG